ncbi:ATP-binding protein [Colwelliaceae bacterium MEBiC 14330]
MSDNLAAYVDEYTTYIYHYVTSLDEHILYQCSEFGKKLAKGQYFGEDLTVFHQFCVEALGDSLSKKQVIKSFDLLTELTVQQTLFIRHEMALKAEAQRMVNDVIEAMPLSIYWKDNKGHYLGCNDTYLHDKGVNNFEELLCQNVLGKDKSNRYHQALSTKELDIINKKKCSYHGERKMILANGETIAIKEAIFPLTNTERQLYGIIGFYENITALKNAESANKKLERTLSHSQRVESVGRLAGGIAHDFNNLLAVIIGYTQLMEKGILSGKNNNKYLDYLQRVLSAADKSKLLTEKLLTFSRKELIKPVVFELYHHLKTTLTTYSTIIDEDIFVSINASEEFWIDADKSHIDQVLLNLIVNARDAMIENCFSKQKRIDITLQHSAQAGFVKLSIKDNGCGMSEETKTRLFEPFFTTKKNTGTGLGLSTVFSIITQNKATIEVNIALAEGTEFIITWPLELNKTETVKTAPAKKFKAKNKPSSQNINISILEDNKQVRELLVSVLSGAGYRVFGYEHSHEMFTELASKKIKVSLLLTDIVLSESLNGKEVSDKFSNIYPDCKIVFVSGYSNEVISKRGIILDGITLIKKPFSNDYLLSEIETALAN